MAMIEPHVCREERKVQARRRRLVHGANTAAARLPQNHRDLTCRWPTRHASRCSSRFGIDIGRALTCGYPGGAKGARTSALTRQNASLPAVSLRLPSQYRPLPAVSFSSLDGVKRATFYCRMWDAPPMYQTWPLTHSPSLESRKAVTAARSAGRPRRVV